MSSGFFREVIMKKRLRNTVLFALYLRFLPYRMNCRFIYVYSKMLCLVWLSYFWLNWVEITLKTEGSARKTRWKSTISRGPKPGCTSGSWEGPRTTSSGPVHANHRAPQPSSQVSHKDVPAAHVGTKPRILDRPISLVKGTFSGL